MFTLHTNKGSNSFETLAEGGAWLEQLEMGYRLRFVGLGTDGDDVELVTALPWNADALGWALGDAFREHFGRVFGSCNVDGGAVFADGWPEPVKYDPVKALCVLSLIDDGHGVTEKGDAEVCRALEAAGAVLS